MRWMTTTPSPRHLMGNLQIASTIIMCMRTMSRKILIIFRSRKCFSRRCLQSRNKQGSRRCMGVRFHLGRRFLGIQRRYRRRIGSRRRRRVIMRIRIILIRAITKNQRKEKRKNQLSSTATPPSNNSSMSIKITTQIPQKTRFEKCGRTLKHKNNQKNNKRTNQHRPQLICSTKPSFPIKTGEMDSKRKGHRADR